MKKVPVATREKDNCYILAMQGVLPKGGHSKKRGNLGEKELALSGKDARKGRRVASFHPEGNVYIRSQKERKERDIENG